MPRRTEGKWRLKEAIAKPREENLLPSLSRTERPPLFIRDLSLSPLPVKQTNRPPLILSFYYLYRLFHSTIFCYLYRLSFVANLSLSLSLSHPLSIHISLSLPASPLFTILRYPLPAFPFFANPSLSLSLSFSHQLSIHIYYPYRPFLLLLSFAIFHRPFPFH